MTWDPDAFPLFGCLTGFTLPVEAVGIADGVALRSGYFHVFTHPMIAFSTASAPGQAHPGPWLPISSNNFIPPSRVEFRIDADADFLGLPASVVAWLLAAVLRLRVEAPVRIPAVANIELRRAADMTEETAIAFEDAHHQNGLFRGPIVEATPEILGWVTKVFPNALSLYHHDRFMRAFTVFDDASWSPRPELATMLIWTAVEVLFDKSASRDKGREIADALSDFVAHSSADREDARRIIRDLYQKRGRIVHSGRQIDRPDFGQSLKLARAAFVNTLTTGEPPAHT